MSGQDFKGMGNKGEVEYPDLKPNIKAICAKEGISITKLVKNSLFNNRTSFYQAIGPENKPNLYYIAHIVQVINKLSGRNYTIIDDVLDRIDIEGAFKLIQSRYTK